MLPNVIRSMRKARLLEYNHLFYKALVVNTIFAKNLKKYCTGKILLGICIFVLFLSSNLLGKNEKIFVHNIGFDENDSTDFVQEAIDSGAKEIVLKNMNADWVLGPVFLQGNQNLILDKGVVISARPEAFENTDISIINSIGQRNIKITGNNCIIEMPVIDKSLESQWTFRNCISLWGCGNIDISGISFAGGEPYAIGLYPCIDGYPEFLPCRGVNIVGCKFEDNKSACISIYSAQDIRIAKCEFRNSLNGLEIQPLSTVASLQNISLTGCRFSQMKGLPFLFEFGKQTRYRPWGKQKQLSIFVNDCNIENSESGIAIKNLYDQKEISELLADSPRRPGGWEGTIEFKDCLFTDLKNRCVQITNKSSSSARVMISDCYFQKSPTRKSGSAYSEAMIFLNRNEKQPMQNFGGIVFEDCVLKSCIREPAVLLQLPADESNVCKVKGNIRVEGEVVAEVVAKPEVLTTDIVIEN